MRFPALVPFKDVAMYMRSLILASGMARPGLQVHPQLDTLGVAAVVGRQSPANVFWDTPHGVFGRMFFAFLFCCGCPLMYEDSTLRTPIPCLIL